MVMKYVYETPRPYACLSNSYNTPAGCYVLISLRLQVSMARGVTRVGVTRGHICGVTPMKCNFFPYFPVSANRARRKKKKIIQIAVALLFFLFFY